MTDLATRLAHSLGGRYTVNRPLGEGGMGVVFHATDLKHDRPVAIKVLRTEAAESLGAERFLREIRITAKLDHPNILMLIDSGEADGLLYYVMPLVDGESLRDRLQREGALPVPDALRLALQVADALAYAHKQGVVHRDVKPENILLSGAHVKLADFGIARATSAPGHTTQGALTQVGMALGTPAYMSPEQFFGEAHLDHRSDLYALACVVFEMLTGAPPFAGEAVTKRLTTDAPRLTATRAGIPPMIDLVVARALAREANDRHASVDEFASALQAEISGPQRARVAGADGAERAAPTRRTLVSRDKELAEADALLAGLADRRGGVLLLGGEPGAGKTRLATAIMERARRYDALCLTGHCYEMEGAPAYAPFAEVLDYVARLVPPHTLRDTLGDAASEVARIQPQLRQQFADIPEPLDLPPDKQRAHLHAQYRAFNERAAQVAPIVLLLDDLHWADEPSLALLSHMATYVDRLPIVILGTYRDTDLDVERPFAATLDTLTRQRLAHRVAVRRLPLTGTAALLAALGGSEPPPALAQALHAETDGNPFFVEEVFQYLREEGRLFDAEGQWLTTIDTAALEVPEGVRLVVGRRLKRLGEPCQAALLSAAVIGPRFQMDTLVALGEHDEDTLLDVLDEAMRAELVVEERGARSATYRFAHELIRQTLLAPLSLPRRQRRHVKVAQALEASLGSKAVTRAADIAFHYYQAGASADEATAVRWLTRAAEAALASGAYAEAAAQCERALAVSEEFEAEVAAPLYAARARSLAAMGRWAEAATEFRRAEQQYRRLAEPDAHAEVLAELTVILTWSGAQPEAIALVESALAAMPAAPSVARVRVLGTLVRAVSQSTGDFERSYALLRQAQAEADAVGTPAARVALATVYPYFCQVFLLGREMVQATTASIALLQEPQHRQELCEMLGLRLWAQRFTGDFSEARRSVNEVVELATDSGHLGAWIYCDVLTGSLRLLDGDLHGFEAWLLGTLDTWKAAGPWGKCNMGSVAILMAERGEVREAQALARASATDDVGYWRGVIEGGEVLAASFESTEAFRRTLARYTHFLVTDDRNASAGRLSFTACALEGFARAAALTEAHQCWGAMRRAEANGLEFLLQQGLLQRSAGIAAAAGGAWREAEQHFATARTQAAQYSQPYFHAHNELWYAWMLLLRNERGDRARALKCLDRAEPIFASFGCIEQVKFIGDLRAGTGAWRGARA